MSVIVIGAGHDRMRAEIAATCGPHDAAAFDRFPAPAAAAKLGGFGRLDR